MISPERFIFEWGAGELVRSSPKAFENTRIPEVSRDFLVKAGLPKNTVLQLSFDRSEDELPRLWEAFHDQYDLPPDYNRYLALGTGYVPIICLDESKGGSIYAVDVADYHSSCFMNSSVPQLAETLLAWRTSVEWAEQNAPNDAEAAHYAQQLKRTIQRIDPRAIEDENSYWRQALRDALI